MKSNISFDIRGGILAKNTFLNLLGYGIPLIIGLVSIPILIKYLGTERFGILTLVWVVFGYFSIFNLGLSLATTKFTAELLGKGEEKNIPDYLWTSVFTQLILGILGTLLFIGASSFLVSKVLNISYQLIPEAKKSFLLIALSLPFVLISASFRGVLEAAQRFDLVNIVKIPSSTANYVIPLVCVLMGFGLPGIVTFILIGRIITLMVWFMLCYWEFPQLKSKIVFRKDLLKPLFSFGGWITVSNIINPFFAYIDRFIIGAILTMEVVSYYTAPFEMIMQIGILPSSLMLTLFPTFSSLYAKRSGERIRLFFARSFKYLLIIIGGIVIVLMFYAPVIMDLWLGEEFYLKSTRVFQILAVGVLINSLARIPSGFLQGIGRTDVIAKLHMVEFVIYFPIAFLFIKWQGINGAALAWTIRASIDAFFLFLFSWEKTGMSLADIKQDRILQSLLILIIFAAGGIAAGLFPLGIYSMAFLSIIFVVVIWYFAFSMEERVWFIDRVKAGFKKRNDKTEING